MSELSMPTSTSKKKTELLCAGGGGGSYLLPLCFIFFFLICFIIISKLITYFLLPYLLNLLHFLSPLLITTLFVLFIFTSYNTFIHNPPHKLEENHDQVYNIFFEEAASQFEQEEEESQELVDKFLISVNDNATQDRNPPPEKTLQDDQQKHDHQSCDVLSEAKDQVKEIHTDSKIFVLLRSESKTGVVSDKECVSRTFLQNGCNKVVEGGENEYEKMMSMRSVGSYGSMRVDKEWKKTLACKLFEERHNSNIGDGNAGDEEGMDLLWEAYEDKNNNNTSSAKNAKLGDKNKKKLEKKRSVGSTKSSRYKDMKRVEDDDEDDDEDEEEVMGGKICCLQALKFSSGKVNLGMGRPNIGRISKAFRGIGWLHHVSSKKGSSTLKPKVVFG